MFLNNLFLNKKAATPEKAQKEMDGLNEEMLSENAEAEPEEGDGLPEVFEKNGEEEPAKKEEQKEKNKQ